MTALATDNFNRANAANLGANWTSNVADITIASNKATVTADPAGEYNNTVTWPNDQYSQTIISTLPGGGQSAGPTARNATDGSFYAYVATFNTNSELFKSIVGVGYTTFSSAGPAITAGDVLKVRASSTAVSGDRNGTQQLTTTDSSLTTGRAGICGFGSGVMDDFEGGDFATGSLPPGLGPNVGMEVFQIAGQVSMMR